MTAHYADEQVTLYAGDCLDVLRSLPDCSVDACITDPPYGLSDLKPAQVTAAIVAWASGDRENVPDARGFMGRSWDAFVPPPAVWDECYRVLKPGGHIAAFAGTRTMDLMGLSIRMAGFEIRDGIGAALPGAAAWVYGSGMPKGQNIGKAIDRMAGAEREVIGRVATPFKVDAAASRGTSLAGSVNGDFSKQVDENGYRYTEVTAPATAEAAQWDGWNTSLKPSWEPIILARRPIAARSVAANVLQFGTGALNIDATRVGGAWVNPDSGQGAGRATANADGSAYGKGLGGVIAEPHPQGRWPANVLLTHAPDCDDSACQPGCPVSELDTQSGTSASVRSVRVKPGGVIGNGHTHGTFVATQENVGGFNDSGGASRFFPSFRYQAKAPTSERPKVNGVAHPTCKPLAVMSWLVKLLTPPGGTVLEPFAGSGTTIEAAMLEGFRVIGIERETDYLPLIEHRIARARENAAQPEEAAPALFDIGEAS